MQTTNTLLPKSRLQMEFELPAERLTRSLGDAARRLSQQHRFSGFRPGKAPRAIVERVLGVSTVHDEAMDLLVDAAVREALREQAIVPLDSPQVEIVQAEEGKPVLFKATVQVRPEVKLGDFENFKFKPEVPAVDETMVEKVLDELRDSEAHLEQMDGRSAQKGDYAIIGFEGTRDGVPFEGGSSERMPMILGEDRLIPGFEDHIVGMTKDDEREFDIVFPDDYQEESLRGRTTHFKVTLKDLRAKVRPEANDEFAKSVGKFADMAELMVELRKRLEANALDHARHDFADKIIDYATGNSTIELPDVLIDQEVEVMHDELRSSLSRQGISEEAYLKVTGKTEADIHEQFRPAAEKRAKTLLVLSEIATAKAVVVPDADVEAEVNQARSRYATNQPMVRYFESDRGRNYIKSTLRRSRTVEQLVDQYLAAHPEAPRLVHLEDTQTGSAVAGAAAETAASVGLTDVGNLTPPAGTPTGA
jgi:trigger factor